MRVIALADDCVLKVFLKPSRYTYSLTYRTNRQIGFFERFDELYWNVTGNGWRFPIERAAAVVELPTGATVIETIFAWPGMGRVMVNAVTARDYPVVMALTVVFAVLVVMLVPVGVMVMMMRFVAAVCP